jgi:ABC-type branched-subunit amino acid transport system substrate-binding protein
MRASCLLLSLAVTTAWSTPAAADLDDAEARGKQIYFTGTSQRGNEINAVVGDEATLLPAMAIPCVNCHGYDGLGRPEGGVIPTDIRWAQLTKSYGHVHEHGRRHGPFDEAALGQTVVAGMDPAGNRLDTTMPIYVISEEDLADLVAYLKVLEQDLDPGIDADAVRVATLLPQEGRLESLGQAMEAALRASFAEVNERGGVFGRKIELVTVPLGQSPGDSIENVQAALDNEDIFAFVSGYTVGIDDDLLAMLRWDKVPLVGPFTLDPGDAYLDAAAFYLYPGFPEQVRALADQAVADVDDIARLIIASPADGRHDELAATAEDQLERRTGKDVTSVRFETGNAAALVTSPDGADVDAVLFLGSSNELDGLLNAYAGAGIAPRVYTMSSLLAQPPFDAPRVFDQRIFVAFPTTSSDITPAGRARYADLASRYELPPGHIQAQAAAIAAASVFTEGLQRAGRNLSRTRLTDGIEALYNFETGFTPPLVYGPNQRIGARGAHILTVDLEQQTYTQSTSGWRLLR